MFMKEDRAWLAEEEVYSRFSEMFDLDVFALELEYGDRIGAVIREGVEDMLDRKQRDFEAILAAHPATIAKKRLRDIARQLEEERLRRIAKRKEKTRRARTSCSARRWQSRLAPARAS